MTALPCWQDGFARNHPFWDPRPFQLLRCRPVALNSAGRGAGLWHGLRWTDCSGTGSKGVELVAQDGTVHVWPVQVVLTDRSERALHVVQQSAKERAAVGEQQRGQQPGFGQEHSL